MQPALEILARQEELRELAQRCVDDVNESRLLVHNVMSRAFRHFHGRDGLPATAPERMRLEIKRLAGLPRDERAPASA